MPNGTGNFQISRKKDNLRRLSTIFETNFQKRSVPFDFVPEFPEILVKWIAPLASSPRIQCSVHNGRTERLWREMNRVVTAIYKDIFASIFNFIEVSCLLDLNFRLFFRFFLDF